MNWGNVDGARAYIGGLQGGKVPSRKVIYKMVAAGLRVARVGDGGRRLLFCQEWIDEFLQACAEPAGRRRATAAVPQASPPTSQAAGTARDGCAGLADVRQARERAATN